MAVVTTKTRDPDSEPALTVAEAKSVGGCLDVSLAFLLAPGLYLLRGWAAHLLWGWFLDPLVGVPSPGTVGLAGLLCLFAVVRLQTPSVPQKGSHLARLTAMALSTLLALGAGYLMHAILQ